MKLLKVLTVIGSLALLALAWTPGLKADTWDQRSTLTFSQPIEVPGGKVLPAGTYVFKLVDITTDRNVVQIFNADETQVFATILTISNYRLHAAENTTINFAERSAGSPEAIKAWFFPGKSWGQEFVYPKARAVELAKEVNEPVPSMPAELTPNITAPTSSAREEPFVAMEKAPLKAEEPSGEEVPVTTAFPPTNLSASLPKTASSLPLFGLIGLMSLSVAFALQIIAKQIS